MTLPACWGYCGSVKACTTCTYYETCQQDTEYAKQQTTLLELVRALRGENTKVVTVRRVRPSHLFYYICSLWEKYAGHRSFHMNCDELFLRIAPKLKTLIPLLEAQRINPEMFIAAQMERHQLVIPKGAVPSPTWFVGPKAFSYYARWIARGAENLSRNASIFVTDEEFLAATYIYAEWRYIHELPEDIATMKAKEVCPLWDKPLVHYDERIYALYHVVAAIDPTLPARLVVPDTAITWQHIEELTTHLKDDLSCA